MGVEEYPLHSYDDDGIRSLIEHWKRQQYQAFYNQSGSGFGQVFTPLPLYTESEEYVGKPSLNDGEILLQACLVLFGDTTKEGQLVQGVTIPWLQIIKEWEQDPEFIFRIKPRQLEELVAGAYEQAGWSDVVLTPHSGDKGRDVIVTATLPGIGTIRIVDQVKRYDKHHRVTADDVRALVGVLSRDQDVSKGIVTTTSDFAPGIYDEYKEFTPTRLELKNGSALKEWLSKLSK